MYTVRSRRRSGFAITLAIQIFKYIFIDHPLLHPTHTRASKCDPRRWSWKFGAIGGLIDRLCRRPYRTSIMIAPMGKEDLMYICTDSIRDKCGGVLRNLDIVCILQGCQKKRLVVDNRYKVVN